MKTKSHRPERTSPEAADKQLLETRGAAKKGIQKQVTVLKTTDSDGGGGGGATTGIFSPSEEQLEKINRFTRSPKSAEEVVCFRTLSCNDLEDRDDDQFTTQCVKDFAALPEPLSSVGKSYMVSHDTRTLPVGRIFDVGTEKVGDGLFLTNEVYMPNTDQYKSFIENLDYGVYWAVSVGVMLGASDCKVCDAPFAWHGMWCVNHHEKGLHYDPKSTETDDWGWPIPTDPSDKRAVKCVQRMFEPKDFYELSQVYLGAQYYAELSKDPNFSGIMKAASAKGVPVIGLSREEAHALPIPAAQEKLLEARQRFQVRTEEDGTMSWTDDQGLVWNFAPEDDQVLCLGRADTNKEGTDGHVQREHPGERDASGEGDDPLAEGDLPDEGSGEGTPAPGDQGSDDQLGSGGSPGPEVAGEDEDDMDKTAVLAAATKAKLPTSLLEKLSEAAGNGLDLVLTELVDKTVDLEKQVATLTAKAAMGEEYLKDLRAETISWFVKANQSGDATKGVATDTVDRILTACGDNVDLIKTLRDQYIDLARSKFPESVRRSTFPDDANARTFSEDDLDGGRVDTTAVKRIHS